MPTPTTFKALGNLLNVDLTSLFGDQGQLVGPPVVASATTTTLPLGEPVVLISGTTAITTLTAGPSGARVTLIFQGILNFTKGNNIKISATYATTADDTIYLVSDGTNWYEAGRSVN